MLCKFQLLFCILMGINPTENFIMNSSLLASAKSNAFVGVPKMKTTPTEESISFFFYPSTSPFFRAVTKEGSILCQE